MAFMTFFLLLSFQAKEIQPLTLEELKIQTFEKKIVDYKEEQLAICRNKIITQAEIYVDSLIAYELGGRKLDSLFVPLRPIRPLIDSLDFKKLEEVDIKPVIGGKD